MRWHSQLSSLQNAASSITLGALAIQRATGFKKTPELTEKNAINTFLLFSPSLSPDLFMFLELCLHSLAFIEGDSGCCSAPLNGIYIGSRITQRTQNAATRNVSVRAQSSICFALNGFFCTAPWVTLQKRLVENYRSQSGRALGAEAASARARRRACAAVAQVQLCKLRRGRFTWF